MCNFRCDPTDVSAKIKSTGAGDQAGGPISERPRVFCGLESARNVPICGHLSRRHAIVWRIQTEADPNHDRSPAEGGHHGLVLTPPIHRLSGQDGAAAGCACRGGIRSEVRTHTSVETCGPCTDMHVQMCLGKSEIRCIGCFSETNHLENYLFSLSKKMLSRSKYPKMSVCI